LIVLQENTSMKHTIFLTRLREKKHNYKGDFSTVKSI
jgi:hypothetical protein